MAQLKCRSSVFIKHISEKEDFQTICLTEALIDFLTLHPVSENGKSDYSGSYSKKRKPSTWPETPKTKKVKGNLDCKLSHTALKQTPDSTEAIVTTYTHKLKKATKSSTCLHNDSYKLPHLSTDCKATAKPDLKCVALPSKIVAIKHVCEDEGLTIVPYLNGNLNNGTFSNSEATKKKDNDNCNEEIAENSVGILQNLIALSRVAANRGNANTIKKGTQALSSNFSIDKRVENDGVNHSKSSQLISAVENGVQSHRNGSGGDKTHGVQNTGHSPVQLASHVGKNTVQIIISPLKGSTAKTANTVCKPGKETTVLPENGSPVKTVAAFDEYSLGKNKTLQTAPVAGCIASTKNSKHKKESSALTIKDFSVKNVTSIEHSGVKNVPQTVVSPAKIMTRQDKQNLEVTVPALHATPAPCSPVLDVRYTTVNTKTPAGLGSSSTHRQFDTNTSSKEYVANNNKNSPGKSTMIKEDYEISPNVKIIRRIDEVNKAAINTEEQNINKTTTLSCVDSPVLNKSSHNLKQASRKRRYHYIAKKASISRENIVSKSSKRNSKSIDQLAADLANVKFGLLLSAVTSSRISTDSIESAKNCSKNNKQTLKSPNKPQRKKRRSRSSLCLTDEETSVVKDLIRKQRFSTAKSKDRSAALESDAVTALLSLGINALSKQADVEGTVAVAPEEVATSRRRSSLQQQVDIGKAEDVGHMSSRDDGHITVRDFAHMSDRNDSHTSDKDVGQTYSKDVGQTSDKDIVQTSDTDVVFLYSEPSNKDLVSPVLLSRLSDALDQNCATSVSDQRGAKPVSDQSGAKPVSDQSGAKPVSDQRGAKPVSDQSGAKPVSDQRGAKPVSDQRGVTIVSENIKQLIRCRLKRKGSKDKCDDKEAPCFGSSTEAPAERDCACKSYSSCSCDTAASGKPPTSLCAQVIDLTGETTSASDLGLLHHSGGSTPDVQSYMTDLAPSFRCGSTRVVDKDSSVITDNEVNFVKNDSSLVTSFPEENVPHIDHNPYISLSSDEDCSYDISRSPPPARDVASASKDTDSEGFCPSTSGAFSNVGQADIVLLSQGGCLNYSQVAFLSTAATGSDVAFLSGPVVTSSDVAFLSGPAVTSSDVAFLSGPPVTSSDVAFLSGPPVTSSDVAFLSGPVVTSSDVAFLSGPVVTSSDVAFLSGPVVTSSNVAFLSGPASGSAVLNSGIGYFQNVEIRNNTSIISLLCPENGNYLLNFLNQSVPNSDNAPTQTTDVIVNENNADSQVYILLNSHNGQPMLQHQTQFIVSSSSDGGGPVDYSHQGSAGGPSSMFEGSNQQTRQPTSSMFEGSNQQTRQPTSSMFEVCNQQTRQPTSSMFEGSNQQTRQPNVFFLSGNPQVQPTLFKRRPRKLKMIKSPQIPPDSNGSHAGSVEAKNLTITSMNILTGDDKVTSSAKGSGNNEHVPVAVALLGDHSEEPANINLRSCKPSCSVGSSLNISESSHRVPLAGDLGKYMPAPKQTPSVAAASRSSLPKTSALKHRLILPEDGASHIPNSDSLPLNLHPTEASSPWCHPVSSSIAELNLHPTEASAPGCQPVSSSITDISGVASKVGPPLPVGSYILSHKGENLVIKKMIKMPQKPLTTLDDCSVSIVKSNEGKCSTSIHQVISNERIHSTNSSHVKSNERKHSTKSSQVKSNEGKCSTSIHQVKSNERKHSTDSSPVKSNERKPSTDSSQVKSNERKHSTDSSQVKSNEKKHSTDSSQVKSNERKHSTDSSQVKSNERKHSTNSSQVKSNKRKHSTNSSRVKSNEEKCSPKTPVVKSNKKKYFTRMEVNHAEKISIQEGVNTDKMFTPNEKTLPNNPHQKEHVYNLPQQDATSLKKETSSSREEDNAVRMTDQRDEACCSVPQPSFQTKRTADWDVDDVAQWLTHYGLQQFMPHFSCMRGEDLLNLKRLQTVKPKEFFHHMISLGEPFLSVIKFSRYLRPLHS